MLLYIDPGTGSMLFALLMGVFGTLVYCFRILFYKVWFFITGGRGGKRSKEKIPYVIFSDDKRYWTTFEPICDYFENRGLKLEYWTMSEDDPGLSKKYHTVRCRFVGKGNKGFVKLNQMNAGICLSTTPGLDVYQWKRSRDVDWYVHIFHAVSQATGYKMFGIDFYDAALLTGPLAEKNIRMLEEMRGIQKKELEICGCTYLDEMEKRKKAERELCNVEKTILIAPSWGESGLLSKYGEKVIDALLKTPYHIIIRPHPQSLTSEKEILDAIREKYPDSDRVEWNYDADNFDVLYRSDILISDFSGVIFDYALIFEKPVIYADTSYDAAPYDQAWIGETPWMITVLDEIGVQLTEDSLDHIEDIIKDALNNNSYFDGRAKAKAQLWSVRGDAAERISEYMIRKYEEFIQAA